jgi:hypothetical protein
MGIPSLLRESERVATDGAAPGAAPLRHRRPWVVALLVVILGQMLAGMVLASRDESPTFDEPAHIAAAFAYVYEHDVTWNWEHPPLVKLLSGLALRAHGFHVPTDSQEFATHFEYGWGRVLMFNSGNDPGRVLQVARLPIMLLTVAFGLVVFGFSRDLWGTDGGLLSVALFSVTPDVLAHGHLVTTDLGVSGLLVTTMWMLWRAYTRRLRYLVPATVTMGLALASKFTALAFLPVFVVLTAVVAWRRGAAAPAGRGGPRGRASVAASAGIDLRRLVRALGWVVAATLGAFAVLWAVYLAVDPKLDHRRETSPFIAAAHGPVSDAAGLLPVPSAYLNGFRFILGGAEQADKPAMLLGHRYHGGNPFFYPVGLLVKTPLGALVLWVIGAVVAVRRRRTDVLLFVGVPAAVWMATAVTSNLNIGVRHVLPVVLLATVVAGAAVSRGVALAVRRAAVALLVLVGVSTWVAFPNYLAYSNEAFGGVDKTYERLTDSSVDWGQDLPRLRTWLDEHALGEVLYLDYFGQVPVEAYGLEPQPVPPTEQLLTLTDGILAVSATNYDLQVDRYAPLGDPDAVVGGSILIFELPRSR